MKAVLLSAALVGVVTASATSVAAGALRLEARPDTMPVGEGGAGAGSVKRTSVVTSAFLVVPDAVQSPLIAVGEGGEGGKGKKGKGARGYYRSREYPPPSYHQPYYDPAPSYYRPYYAPPRYNRPYNDPYSEPRAERRERRARETPASANRSARPGTDAGAPPAESTARPDPGYSGISGWQQHPSLSENAAAATGRPSRPAMGDGTTKTPSIEFVDPRSGPMTPVR